VNAVLYFLGARRQALVTHALVDMTTMLANEDSEIGGREIIEEPPATSEPLPPGQSGGGESGE
jgi:hypothetical protein